MRAIKGFSNVTEEEQEVDFDVLKEDWNRYKLKDGTMLKVKTPVMKIFKSEEEGPLGYPNLRVGTRLLAVTTAVPEKLKDEPSEDQEIRKEDITEEVKIVGRLKEEWHEYKTHDGWKILVKPVVIKVFKTNKFNDDREPIYNVTVQSLFNVEKFSE